MWHEAGKMNLMSH